MDRLETEWVLRSRYKRSNSEIADFFALMLQKKQITCENAQALPNAIYCYRLGADFADALHLTKYYHYIIFLLERWYLRIETGKPCFRFLSSP